MKFQKYLREVESTGPPGLTNLNYKLLKAEVKELRAGVEAGLLSREAAASRFAARLRAELEAVGAHWARHVRLLGDRADELFRTADALLRGDFAFEALCEPLRPVTLLEPLRPWLELASWADALRRHRLLQAAAVVKIEKKFVKTMCGGQPAGCGCEATCRPACEGPGGVEAWKGFDGAQMLAESQLGGDAVHLVCRQLEAIGDALLRLGLGCASGSGAQDPCAICLGGITDPARLPCGHRFCVHCVLPLFDTCDGADSEEGAAMLRCPLCRAAGPAAPQALSLDGLLPRLERGLGRRSDDCCATGEEFRFTAVVVSSLARLAAHSGAAGGAAAASAGTAVAGAKAMRGGSCCMPGTGAAKRDSQRELPKAAGPTHGPAGEGEASETGAETPLR